MTGDRALCAGRYRLERVLGRGPSGVVYAAMDVQSGQPCALKRIHAQFYDEVALLALQREAQLARAVGHAAVVAPSATGFDEDGAFYLAGERVAGESLRARLQRGPVAPAQALDILSSVCAALEAAHGLGLHHGNLCPANILCPAEGPARITDFGMHHLGGSADALWTGPAGYLPPELYRGEAKVATAAGDVFTLGALLFECLTGQRLFDGTSAAAVMFKVCIAPLPALPASVPADRERLDALIAMACSKDPAGRFDHAGALLRAMQVVLREAPERMAAPDASTAPVPAVSAPVPPLFSAIAAAAPVTPSPAIAAAPPPLVDLTPVGAKVRRGPDLERWSQHEDPPQAPPRPRYGVIAGWAAGGGLTALALLVVLHGGSGPAPPTPAAPPAATAAALDTAPTPSAAAVLLGAEEKLLGQDYIAALAMADDLLRRHPGDPAARDLVRRARDALRLQAVYQGFVGAAERGDVEAAVALYRELSPSSPFRERARARFAAVRGRFEAHHLGVAGAALDRGACDEVLRQLDQLLLVAERADDWAPVQARRLLGRCRGRGAQVAQAPAGATAGAPAGARGDLVTPDFRGGSPQPLPMSGGGGPLKDPFRGGKLPPQR